MPTMAVLAPLMTGLGLFCCGVRVIAANLAPLAGATARRLFRRAVSTTWMAALTGIVAGLVTQSTNAVSLIVVGFVRAGVLPEKRAVLLPTWSHVGAAALVILVSIQTNVAVAYALALAGGALYFDFDLSERVRHGVLVLLGLGMLFLGLEMLKVAGDPLRAWLLDKGLLTHGETNPVAPLLLGAILAIVTQSSTVAGAIAAALVRVGVFDLGTALVLLAGAGAGSSINYALLGRRGEAVGRHILMFQAAQKLFGALFLAAPLALVGAPFLSVLAGLGASPASRFAWVFLAMQVGGSLACTLAHQPLSALLKRLAPPTEGEALAKPAFLLDEALGDPSLALALAAREERRLLERLPLMLDGVRAQEDPSQADQGAPSADQLKVAGLSVAEVIRRYIAGILESEPGRRAVVRAMRLQQALDNIVALHEALFEFDAAVRTAASSEGAARTLGHMVESLHMLLETAAEIVASEDPAEQQLSLALLGDREEIIEGLRTRLMDASQGASAKAQEALFRSTILFERILWLARDTALASIQSGQAEPASA